MDPIACVFKSLPTQYIQATSFYNAINSRSTASSTNLRIPYDSMWCAIASLCLAVPCSVLLLNMTLYYMSSHYIHLGRRLALDWKQKCYRVRDKYQTPLNHVEELHDLMTVAPLWTPLYSEVLISLVLPSLWFQKHCILISLEMGWENGRSVPMISKTVKQSSRKQRKVGWWLFRGSRIFHRSPWSPF